MPDHDEFDVQRGGCPVTLERCERPACHDGCGYIGNWPPPPQPEHFGRSHDDRCPHGFPSGGWDCCRHDPSLDDHMEDT